MPAFRELWGIFFEVLSQRAVQRGNPESEACYRIELATASFEQVFTYCLRSLS